MTKTVTATAEGFTLATHTNLNATFHTPDSTGERFV